MDRTADPRSGKFGWLARANAAGGGFISVKSDSYFQHHNWRSRERKPMASATWSEEIVLLHGERQQFEGRFGNGAKFFKFTATHAGVAGDFASGETFLLNLAGSDDTFADSG